MPRRRRRPNAIRMRPARIYILYHNASVTENNINDKVEYAYYNNNKNNTVYGNSYYILCVVFYAGMAF